MLNDIVYAGFSQLSYCNWNKIDEKIVEELKKNDESTTKNRIKELENKVLKLIQDEYIWTLIKTDECSPKEKPDFYPEEDKRLLIQYRENPYDIEDTKYKNLFEGWKFLYAAGHKKLYSKYFGRETTNDTGFQGVAFKNGNDVVIAYRGTKPEILDDLITNLDIGLFNEYATQYSDVIWFYNEIKRQVGDGAKIHFTGHSQGGAHAQFAHICTGCKHPTLTWNPLGVGVHQSEISINYMRVSLRPLCNDFENPNNFTENAVADKIIEKYGNKNDKKKVGLQINYEGEKIEPEYPRYSYRNLSPTFPKARTNIKKIIEKYGTMGRASIFRTIEEVDYVSDLIYWKLKNTYNFNNNLSKVSESKIKNFYTEPDWVPHMQTKLGEYVEVVSGSIDYEQKINDSWLRPVFSAFAKGTHFKYHGVNDFLIYMNKDGKIEPGKIQEIHLKNFAKGIVSEEVRTNGFEEGYEDVELGKIAINLLGNEGYSDVIKSSLEDLEDKKLWKDEENDFISIGKFTNYEKLAGIEGQKPLFIPKNNEDKEEEKNEINEVEELKSNDGFVANESNTKINKDKSVVVNYSYTPAKPITEKIKVV